MRLVAGALAALAVATIALLAPSPAVRSTFALLPLHANDDTLSTRHDRLATVAAPGVLANDLNLLSGTTAVLDSPTSHGTVALQPNGGYAYQPAASYVGVDQFTYHDSGLLPSNTATVTITVTNAAPVASDDAYSAVAGVTLTVPAPGVLGNDHDADGDAMRAAIVASSGNGSVSLASNGGFTFTSGGSFTGVRTFTYEVSDGLAVSNTATVSITVAPAATQTPAPTPTSTPAPTPTPTPRPTAAPTPTPTVAPPTLPLPSAPVPSLPLPSISLPVPSLPLGATPSPNSNPSDAGSSTPPSGSGASGSPADGPSGPAPGSGTGGPGGSPADAGGTGGFGAGGPGGGGGGTPAGPRGFVVGGSDSSVDGTGGIEITGFGSPIDWVVPSLVLSVPGLLLVIAVLAQAVGGLAWIPLVRRWLGDLGIGRRHRRREPAGSR